VLRGIAGGIAAAALPAVVAQDAATGNLYISDLAPGVKVIDVSSVNIVTLATNAGLVVVDSGNETMQRTVLDRLRQVAGANGKLAVLVNTHWHRDQTGANEALAQAGATIVAHDKTRQRLRAGWYVPSVGPPVQRAEVQAEHDWLLAIFDRMVVNLRLGQTPDDMRNAGVLDGLPRKLTDPAKFLYDAQKGFWANHNKLMHDIV
jgi:glyoxylase-like metal-dependent hydrolase (beta-lactamase superfamily II)